MKTAGPDLELDSVSKSYGDVLAVNQVSFRVGRGEFVTLLGPSGGGKTSTLRIVAGFLRPDSGCVLLRGEVVNDVPPYERDIGMVFQNYALFPHMSVQDNVAFGLRMRGISRGELASRIRDMLALVRLAGYERRSPDKLSGGQQQRVALARALVIQPSLLLLDEPLSNLDATLRVSMQRELRQIVDRVGVTTLYVTHNQEEALSMSDRVVVMSNGRVEQVGSPGDVYNYPANEFVAGFVGRSNLIRCRVVSRDEQLTTAKMESGDVVLVSSLPTGPADEQMLLVRPELIEIAEPTISGMNCFRGTVSHAAFLGAAIEYMVEAAGQTFIVHQPAGRHRRLFLPGEEVVVRWDPTAAVSLNAD